MATYTLDEKTRKATLTISGDTTITFPTKLDIFGVRSLDGADILVSKLKAPTTLEDGVYSTDEGDGDVVIDDGVFTDTLYLKGSGKVAIYGAVKGAQSPFKIGAKGGVRCLGTTTTALYDGSTANPIVIDGVSVTAKRNDIAIYDGGEYMFNGTAWSAFGETMDTQPTQGSAKAVTSDGVYRYTAGQKNLSSSTGGEIFNSYSGMYANSATGDYSHAEGSSNRADGDYSHVEGYSCSTHGEAANSHAEGNSTLAYGLASHAEGGFTQAQGDYSHASGLGTQAMTDASTVVGTYNVPDANGVENLFIVGNGSEDSQGNFTRSNILEVSKTALNVNGDIKKNGTAIAALAFKNTASATYTPAGTVSTPTITVAKETTTVNSITAVGTLPSLVYNENTHMYSLSQGTLPTKGADTAVMTNATATSTQPTFTGTEATIEVD